MSSDLPAWELEKKQSRRMWGDDEGDRSKKVTAGAALGINWGH
jgi:hypothetical protein